MQATPPHPPSHPAQFPPDQAGFAHPGHDQAGYDRPGHADAGPPAPPFAPYWQPLPPRSRTEMLLRFTGTAVHFPLQALVFLVVFALTMVFAMAMEIVCAVLWFLEKPVTDLMGHLMAPFLVRPRWWVNWNELRHENAPEFHRRRVDKRLAKTKPAVTGTRVPFHQYRALGVGGLLDCAAQRGWSLDEAMTTRPHAAVHLTRPKPNGPQTS
ncbi:hypothetical protein [Streptomyces sp. NPDC093589]|uniref:hypothetical protein n=1 Tax=Streptomyces sp. NPDC093589 TaxID=3366043 RepID=UPI00380EBFA6